MKTQITSVDQLADYTGPQLVQFYNQLTGETLKKFADRKTALRRIKDALLVHEVAGKGDATALHTEAATNHAAHAEPKSAPRGKGLNYEPKTIRPLIRGKRLELLNLLLKGATLEQVSHIFGEATENNIRVLGRWHGYGIKTEGNVITAYTN